MAILFVFSVFIALASGGVSVLLGALRSDEMSSHILRTVRLPRILVGAVVGANLAVSGSALQALFRNPLASPFILGVSGGSALGVTIAFAFLPFLPWPAPAFLGFLIALLTAYAVFRLVRSPVSSLKIESILLAGVMMNAFYGALILLLQFLSDPGRLYQIVSWTMGSLQSSDLEEGLWLAVLSFPAWALLLLRVRLINAFTLGEDIAGTSGIDVERFKRLLYWSTSWLVAVTVSVVGIIPFVGLVVPHMIRRAFGADHRIVVPGSFLGGAAFLLLSDALGRAFFSPLELPPGVVTSLVGTPVFLWIMRETDRREA